jgi:hypothetical protein
VRLNGCTWARMDHVRGRLDERLLFSFPRPLPVSISKLCGISIQMSVDLNQHVSPLVPRGRQSIRERGRVNWLRTFGGWVAQFSRGTGGRQ